MNNLKMEKTPLSFFVVNDIRNAMLETVNRLREQNSHLVDEDTKNLFAQKLRFCTQKGQNLTLWKGQVSFEKGSHAVSYPEPRCCAKWRQARRGRA